MRSLKTLVGLQRPFKQYLSMHCIQLTCIDQRQINRDRSISYRASASLGYVVLTRPSKFVGCVLLLPSEVKTLVAGFAFLFLKV